MATLERCQQLAEAGLNRLSKYGTIDPDSIMIINMDEHRNDTWMFDLFMKDVKGLSRPFYHEEVLFLINEEHLPPSEEVAGLPALINK